MSTFADELLDDLGSEDGSQQQQPNDADGEPVANSSKSAEAPSSKRKFDDDLDDLSDGDQGEDSEALNGDAGSAGSDPNGIKLSKNAVQPAEELTSDDVNSFDMATISSVSSISSLLTSHKLQRTLKDIDESNAKVKQAEAEGSNALTHMQLQGTLEHSDEYQLIVATNNLAVEVDNEIILVHKFIRDHYSPRFPELESLIVNPWEYVQAVEALGNTDDLTSPEKGSLESILPHGTVVVISMTASTTNGKRLPNDAWQRVQEGCRVVRKLDEVRTKVLSYVEDRIGLIAPNLSALVGSRVATKLLGVSGGLTGLSKIPACNIQVLGASKKTSIGLSGLHSADRHVGFINQAPLMAEVPPEYKRQATRLISAKIALVARMDANHSTPLGTYGSKLRQELEQKIEKLLEPPPAKMIKALPVPKEGSDKKRRGGRRARKFKEMYGASELRKAANRVEFGKAEEEAGAFDETVGLGMASAGAGKIRATGGENRTKARMSKKNQSKLEQLQKSAGNRPPKLDAMDGPSGSRSTVAGASDSSGTQTSLSFTPVQGIELADPSRQRKVDEANQRWFQKGAFSLVPGVKGGATPLVPEKKPSSIMGPPALPKK